MSAVSASRDWRTYDHVTGIYQRVDSAVFLPPARDLVAMIQPARGERVLDIGTGTGWAARTAAEVVGSSGMAAGLDPALNMLRIAGRRGVRPLVGGDALHLPFASNAFHAVVASFVLSHFTQADAALAEIGRVIATGGRFGATAWGAAKTELAEAWKDVAHHFRARFGPGIPIRSGTRTTC